MCSPIEFLPRSSQAILDQLWTIEFTMLIGYPEVWAPVAPYMVDGVDPNRYSISTYGRVLSVNRERILPQFITNSGYLRVNFLIDREGKSICRAFSVHRLVLMAFNPIFNMNMLQVNHLDENKTHNWLWNLEWVTPSENRQYSMKTGRIKIYGEESPLAKITNAEAERIGYLLSTTNMTSKQIASSIGSHCTERIVDNIMNGSSHPSVYIKYNLSSINRNPRVVSDEKIHQICKFLQDFKRSGNIINTGFGEITKFYDFVAISCGLEINERNRRLISRLYTRTTHKKICDLYDY